MMEETELEAKGAAGLKILIVNWRCTRHPQAGGGERFLFQQARIWVDLGAEVRWLSGRASGLPATEEIDGVEFHRAGGEMTVYPAAWLQYLRLRWKPDVIIDVENGIPFFMPLIARVPIVLLIYHVHTDVWKEECSAPVAWFGNMLESGLMPRMYRRNRIVTISPSSERMVRTLFPSNRIDIVYPALDPVLKPAAKAAGPTLVFVGRLKKYKSVDVLLEGLHKLNDPGVALHLVGQGDDEPRLRALCRTLNLSNVHFHGFVDEATKRELLQQAWLFVNPSLMEGWAITNLEANACGTPVIGADVPGIRDSVKEGISGWLIPHGDPEVLAREVKSYLADAPRRARMEASCRDWAAQFSWENSAMRFLDVLRDVRRD